MLTYKAAFHEVDGVVYGEVLDFPGTLAFGPDLDAARKMLASALVTMAETNLLLGESLPRPDPSRTDPDADLEKPIYFLLSAAQARY
jgi:predicted RNase H-like HicB family nuclease